MDANTRDQAFQVYDSCLRDASASLTRMMDCLGRVYPTDSKFFVSSQNVLRFLHSHKQVSVRERCYSGMNTAHFEEVVKICVYYLDLLDTQFPSAVINDLKETFVSLLDSAEKILGLFSLEELRLKQQ